MKKFNLKLAGATACFVVSLIFLLCSKFSKFCILFACIFVALALVAFALFRQENVKKTLQATEQDLADNPATDEEIAEIQKQAKNLVKKSKWLDFAFYTCAFLMIVVGICAVV